MSTEPHRSEQAAASAYLDASQACEVAYQNTDPEARGVANRRLQEAAERLHRESAAALVPTFEELLRDPATIYHLRQHGSPEVRRTIAQLDQARRPRGVWINPDGSTSPIIPASAEYGRSEA